MFLPWSKGCIIEKYTIIHPLPGVGAGLGALALAPCGRRDGALVQNPVIFSESFKKNLKHPYLFAGYMEPNIG